MRTCGSRAVTDWRPFRILLSNRRCTRTIISYAIAGTVCGGPCIVATLKGQALDWQAWIAAARKSCTAKKTGQRAGTNLSTHWPWLSPPSRGAMRCRAVKPLNTSHPRVRAGNLGIAPGIFAAFSITSRSLQREQMRQDHQTPGREIHLGGFSPLVAVPFGHGVALFPCPVSAESRI